MSSWRLDSVPEVITLEMRHLHMKNYNYLIVDPLTRAAVIVDPAWELHKIDSALADAGARLKGVLLTHSHPDHIHLARTVAQNYDCVIWMSHEEIRLSGFQATHLQGIGREPWHVGGLRIVPLPTPGHTAGCICYLIGDNLFSGDVLFAEGCGLCPDEAGAHAMFASLQYLKTTLAPRTRIFPGHSYGKYPGQTFADLLRDNIYLQIADKHTFATFRLRKSLRISNPFGQ